jgi:hypothetical protein
MTTTTITLTLDQLRSLMGRADLAGQLTILLLEDPSLASASDAEIARRLGCPEPSLRRARAKLRQRGLLREVFSFPGLGGHTEAATGRVGEAHGGASPTTQGYPRGSAASPSPSGHPTAGGPVPWADCAPSPPGAIRHSQPDAQRDPGHRGASATRGEDQTSPDQEVIGPDHARSLPDLPDQEVIGVSDAGSGSDRPDHETISPDQEVIGVDHDVIEPDQHDIQPPPSREGARSCVSASASAHPDQTSQIRLDQDKTRSDLVWSDRLSSDDAGARGGAREGAGDEGGGGGGAVPLAQAAAELAQTWERWQGWGARLNGPPPSPEDLTRWGVAAQVDPRVLTTAFAWVLYRARKRAGNAGLFKSVLSDLALPQGHEHHKALLPALDLDAVWQGASPDRCPAAAPAPQESARRGGGGEAPPVAAQAPRCEPAPVADLAALLMAGRERVEALLAAGEPRGRVAGALRCRGGGGRR